MPAPEDFEQSEPARPKVASRLMKVGAAVTSVGLLVFGAKAIANGDSASSNGVARAQGTQPLSSQQTALRPGIRPGMGAAVTGAALARLKSLVTAKYPGTIERADKLADGSYVVHDIRTNGQELHVRVSKDFTITGSDQGGPGRLGHGHFGPGGMGAAVTGSTLAKLESLVTAKYPGTIERADKLPDGSYVVHDIRTNGRELHVHVSGNFTITGTDQGGPGHGAPSEGGFAPGGRSAGTPS